MSNIGSVLNIAKEALLTHQASISVAGHNIANVDTPGYSRQVLDLTTTVATPTGTGYFGNGVTGDSVTRQYDQFMVRRLANQNSTIENLEAMQRSMRVVESVFNEAPGLAVNDLLSQFWEAWQGLTNNPELSSTRQTVIQQAGLLNTQLNIMASEIVNTRNDISATLSSSVDDFNTITKELATINGRITASETDKHQQNDLRDRRDMLLQDLSGLVDINYFETATGAYTILLSDGHTLVEQNEHWEIDWVDNTMYWLSTNSEDTTTRTKLDSKTSLGGSIGGLVDVNNQLIEGDPSNYLGRLNAFANSVIREVNQQHTQGVGSILFSDVLTSAETADNAVLLHSSIDNRTAVETIAAGSLTINGHDIERIDGGMTSFGLAKTKAYNATQAINNSYAGVHARLTTQVAGDAVSGGTIGGLDSGESVSFTVNGISVSYAAAANETANQTATGVVNAINSAIDTYNAATGPENIPKMTIRATVGTNLNGGAIDSIILQNTNKGDESNIVLAGIDTTPGAADTKLGLTDGTYIPDAQHNTGALSLFTNDGPIDIQGGSDDRILSQLGWASAIRYADQTVTSTGGAISFTLNGHTIAPTTDSLTDILTAINNESLKTGVTAVAGDGTNGGPSGSVVFQSQSSNILVSGVDSAEAAILGFTDFEKRSVAGADLYPDDGQLTYDYADNGVASSLMGLDYADELVTDNGSFNIWLYNSDGTPALPQPVNVSLERAYDLYDVRDAINISIFNAMNDSTATDPWVKASVYENKLILTPDPSHQFAFGGDSSNFLASMGINTFFTGNSADTISINSSITDDMNKLAAGTINQFGELFSGDNSNALAITNIQRKESIPFTGGTSDTLDGHYNSLVADIGLTTRSVDTDLEFNVQVNDQLKQMRDATSGVSLDEEMANLIKFQHAYSAAAKLISASDELLQTLLNAV